MIHIFFGFGMFGHMINYAINRFGFKDPSFKKVAPRHDGSMHSKLLPPLFMHHGCPTNWHDIERNNQHTSAPGYPLLDAKFEDIHLKISSQSATWPDDQKILITSHDLESAALNLLFQYHKVAHGIRNAGMEIFYSGIRGAPYKRWNQNYTDFESMRRWEFREWFSIAWKGIAHDFMVDSRSLQDWLVLDNRHFINDIKGSMHKVMQHCDFEYTPDLDNFLKEYLGAQQYILDEFDLIHKICYSVINNDDFEWDNINVIAEALVQSMLRDRGYDIRCQDLDDFPRTANQLAMFLDPLIME